jgi:hypothetical protein
LIELEPEHEKQKATVAGFVAAAFGRFDQAFHLAAGEVLPVAAMIRRRPVFLVFSSVYHFVESSPCRKAGKPCKQDGAF